MSERLSIIVPTCGRRSLGRTLESIRRQELAAGDEVLLVTDGAQPLARELFRRSGLPGHCLTTEATRNWGGTQRNLGMEKATGDYLLFMDDDDAYYVGALATVRSALRETPGRPHLFRMRYASDGRVLWSDRTLSLGNVSTQMIVVPNDPRLQPWDSGHGHDFRFVCNNLRLWSVDSLAWREEVIAIIRPHEAATSQSGEFGIGPLRVQECPFWEDTGATTCCRLLQQLSGVVDPAWCIPGQGACEACCASSTPSSVTLNPVIASMLYGLADRICQRGGVAGCAADQAARLQDWAESCLTLELPAHS